MMVRLSFGRKIKWELVENPIWKQERAEKKRDLPDLRSVAG
jgi:hypothetical protein